MKNHIVITAFLCIQTLFAQTTAFSEILEEYHSEKQFNGVVLVATNGNIDFLQCKGIGDRQNNTPLEVSSQFKIASMTKVFTAVLIMKLVEEGKIELDKTINQYFPEYYGEGKDKVTIHQLLTYASGIENQLDEQGMEPYQTMITLDDFIKKYCSGNLVFTPGEKSNYGNTEYILLQKIIENVSKKSFGDYLEEIILSTLHLKNTGIVYSEEKLLSGYLFNEETQVFEKEDPYFPEMYFGAGALYSTVEDLLKFDQAIFTYQLLSEETTKTLLTIHPELGYTAYGFWGSTGWGSFKEPFYYRTGAIQGFTANWIHTLENKKTILVLSNTNATNLYALSEKLYLASLAKK
ncbi:MAG: serine hydrolase domain-containing protein [Flavobacteriaceae bacterium]